MRRLKWLTATFLVFMFLVIQICIPVNADAVRTSSNMDVVLVIDVSGSMKKTDPDKIALEGAKLFVDMMENSGSRVGLVAFSDKLVQVYNLTAVNVDSDKKAMKGAIDALEFSGDTDIGTAVQKAVEMLTTSQDVGNNKMILFFTDGEIDLPKGSPNEEEAEKVSRQNAENAISTASVDGIPIYTIGLNVNDGVDTDLISNMSASTEAKSNIVKTAGELPAIFNDIFADFVETEINEIGNITIKDANTYEELLFEIPNDSVLEANIVMITSGNGVLNDVLLVKPDGSEFAPDGQTAILSTSNNYDMLKLIGPDSGTWTLKIKGDQGCQVHVNLLFNYDVILKSSGQADADGNLVVTATLEKNGAPVADEALYGQLSTVACVTRSDGTVTSYPMNLDGTVFSCTVPVEAGEKISVYAHTEGANMYRDSETFAYSNDTVNNMQTEVIEETKQNSILPIILMVMAAVVLLAFIIAIILVNRPKPLVGYLYWQILDEDTFSINTNEEQYDLTFARTKAIVSNFVTELSLAYAGLDKVEIIAAKNGIAVQNKGKTCVLTDENGAEVKKIMIINGGSFKIACKTEDGDTLFVAIRYQRDLNDMLY